MLFDFALHIAVELTNFVHQIAKNCKSHCLSLIHQLFQKLLSANFRKYMSPFCFVGYVTVKQFINEQFPEFDSDQLLLLLALSLVLLIHFGPQGLHILGKDSKLLIRMQTFHDGPILKLLGELHPASGVRQGDPLELFSESVHMGFLLQFCNLGLLNEKVVQVVLEQSDPLFLVQHFPPRVIDEVRPDLVVLALASNLALPQHLHKVVFVYLGFYLRLFLLNIFKLLLEGVENFLFLAHVHQVEARVLSQRLLDLIPLGVHIHSLLLETIEKSKSLFVLRQLQLGLGLLVLVGVLLYLRTVSLQLFFLELQLAPIFPDFYFCRLLPH